MNKFIYYILFTLSINLYAQDIWELTGKWIPETVIHEKANVLDYRNFEGVPPFNFGYHIYGYEKGTSDYCGRIDLVYNGHTEEYIEIKDVDYNNSIYVLDCYDNMLKKNNTLTISFLDSERIKITGLDKKEVFNDVNILYRAVSNPKVRKQKATINTSYVELRSLPSNSGKIIKYLLSGQPCYVVDKAFKTTGEVKDNWYKINTMCCVEGWVSDKYINFIENDFEDDVFVKVKSSTFNNGTNYFCFDRSKLYYASNIRLSVAEINEYIRFVLNNRNDIPNDDEFLFLLNKCNERIIFTKIELKGFICKKNEFFQKLLQSISADSFKSTKNNRLIAVLEKEGAYLLYDIYVGMTKTNMITILGKPDSIKKNVLSYILNSDNGNEIQFSFYFNDAEVCKKIEILKS